VGPDGLQVWAAPPQWRAIDFISDLHLSPGLPQTVAGWAQYLHDSTADAICMLGDLFEVWVGDDGRHQPFECGLVEAIAAAAERHAMFFMVGNRDFLAGRALCDAAHMTALQDPTCLHAWGGRWLLSHGDALCLDDQPYQAFRAQVRTADWQRDFLARPLDERNAMAREMRRRSALHQRQDRVESSGDLDADSCRQWLQLASAPILIHGHTHRPALHDLGDGRQRVVLSDWDLDDISTPRAEILRLAADGTLTRLSPQAACGH
jgi:UDP-2,3-diacylglucosamine hydrolase